jgi:hypothetical protein
MGPVATRAGETRDKNVKRFGTAVAVAAFALSATSASAAILNFTTDGRAVNYQVLDSDPATAGNQSTNGTALAGSFTATQTGPGTSGLLGNGIALSGFAAYCLDLAGNLANGEFAVNNTNPFQPGRVLTGQQIDNVKALYNASYGLVDESNRNQSAGFQLALWEVVYESTAAPFNLADGNFKTSTLSGTIFDFASSYLGRMITNPNAYAYNVHFLDAEDTSKQDLVTATVVPLPAAGLLLLGGLAALRGLRRRGAAIV